MKKNQTLLVKGNEVSLLKHRNLDYISLTDMAKAIGDDSLIYSWMRNRNTLEFIGIWEEMNNPDFKGNEFVTFRSQAGLNSFNMTPKKWISSTNAMGIISKAGRYGGGTFAHRDIAFEFGSWLSPEFKLYLIKEFQRLKEDEHKRENLEWNFQRMLATVNYRIHTDAIRDHLVPETLTREQINRVYASEADVLNIAIFGKTAKEWLESQPDQKGNLRDHATIEQLVVLSNLESINAVFIQQKLSQSKRLEQLNAIAITQLTSLLKSHLSERLKTNIRGNIPETLKEK